MGIPMGIARHHFIIRLTQLLNSQYQIHLKPNDDPARIWQVRAPQYQYYLIPRHNLPKVSIEPT